VLVRIDNPETIAKHEQALAAKVVADAQLANINVGTRPEVIAARKAALERRRRLSCWQNRPTNAFASWPNVATPRRRDSIRRPIACMKPSARRSGQVGLRTGSQRLYQGGT